MTVEIEVTIRPDGTTTVDVNGVQGPSCAISTDALIRALGGAVVEDNKKAEFYQAQTTKEVAKAGGKEVW
jgi:hypothetical protein